MPTLNAYTAQNYIAQLAERINIDFQESEEERAKLNNWEWDNEPDFSILELIELYTPYVCGYAGQIASNGFIQKPKEAANHLQKIQFFDKSDFVNWYLSPDNQYTSIKTYVERLDYLRLSTLQYVTLYQTHTQRSVDSTYSHQPEPIQKAA